MPYYNEVREEPSLSISCEASLLRCMLFWHPNFQNYHSGSAKHSTITTDKRKRMKTSQEIHKIGVR